jgi:hypothetical protein
LIKRCADYALIVVLAESSFTYNLAFGQGQCYVYTTQFYDLACDACTKNTVYLYCIQYIACSRMINFESELLDPFSLRFFHDLACDACTENTV